MGLPFTKRFLLLWRSDMMTKRRHTVLCVFFTFLSTLTLLGAVIPNAWDQTDYNIDKLKDRILQEQQLLDYQKEENETDEMVREALKQQKYLNQSLSTCLAAARTYRIERLAAGDGVALMWDSANVTRRECVEGMGRLGKTVNATILMREYSGIWEICRGDYGTKEDMRVWEQIWDECGNWTQKCYNHLHHYVLTPYCCGGCCPYDEKTQAEMDEDGRSTHELLNTMKSSAIVSLILQVLTYIEILLALVFQYVTMHTMSGVTLFLSGMFMLFVLIANHYKIYAMNDVGRSLSYLPCEVLVSGARETTPGPCMWVAWVNVALSGFACVVWIRFSRFLVKDAFKAPQKPPKAIHKPSAAKRLVSAVSIGRKHGAA